ncbi:Transposase IS66 family protein [Deinococcus hopiensis KR-140]|uniref:Transposase IS66 family protein n=1 Tax=Deinococcus hopiensis KR-140 TaxID=695939 RepID=A0A1W1UZH6_9DEIO|nr:transposase [Deinococcus hopiensis]SMB86151.1 Transposase IS66 family protein [Deinococcus hopiensis KR-140]
MAEEVTREVLLEQNAQQAEQIALLITQIKVLTEENARQKKRIEQLERQVKRYVAPHSRETPKVDPKPPGRRAGQGLFSFKHAPALDTVTRMIDVEPANTCVFCRTPLDRRAYKTDLAFITELPQVKPEITQYNVPVPTCPKCGRDVRGRPPDLCPTQRGATAHRLGPRLLAATQYLHHGVGLPERKVPDVLHQLCGVKITQSAVNQATTRTTAAGTPMAEAYQQIKTAVQAAPVVHQDDTGWRINGTQAWLQVACTPQHVLLQIRTQHTHQQLKELLGETFGGTLVADRYNVYDHATFTDSQHQKCIRHVIRNVQEAVVLHEGRRGQDIVYATRLRQAFQDAHSLHRQLSRKEITLAQYRGAGYAIHTRVTGLLDRRPLQSKVNERLRKRAAQAPPAQEPQEVPGRPQHPTDEQCRRARAAVWGHRPQSVTVQQNAGGSGQLRHDQERRGNRQTPRTAPHGRLGQSSSSRCTPLTAPRANHILFQEAQFIYSVVAVHASGAARPALPAWSPATAGSGGRPDRSAR